MDFRYILGLTGIVIIELGIMITSIAFFFPKR
jgi:hypothetical protein